VLPNCQSSASVLGLKFAISLVLAGYFPSDQKAFCINVGRHR
jgi:hypothetical protein